MLKKTNREIGMPPMQNVFFPQEKGYQVDHIDGNGLNNQRSNLRLATRSQNLQNRKPFSGGYSKFKGVNYKKPGKWSANIRIDGRLKHLGYFNDELDAAKAYDDAAKCYFKQFARTNF